MYICIAFEVHQITIKCYSVILLICINVYITCLKNLGYKFVSYILYDLFSI